MITPYYRSSNRDFTLIAGDVVGALESFDFKFDMIFADPPYFLSNGGISISNGIVVCVDKGDWDKLPQNHIDIDSFNKSWIEACREKLKENGTIWISGTHHNIFSIAKQLSLLDFKILNVITWNKTNPPQNISHRLFTHSAEFIIWAKKTKRSFHRFNYDIMCQLNKGEQMTDVWRMPAVSKWEKTCGKHPTQKPLALMSRIILASTKEGDWILDPFNGSGTTGVAASLLGRKYLGIDKELAYLKISVDRREELDNAEIRQSYKEKVLRDYHYASNEESPNLVLIGRVGSKEQWEWFEKSRIYIIPLSKIELSTKLLGATFLLAFFGKNPIKASLCKISKVKPQIKSQSQIIKMASRYGNYRPSRDTFYWVLRLEKPKEEYCNKPFNKSLLLSKNEERAAYWIKEYDKVIRGFNNDD